jgi:hypothetical protein
LQLHQSNPDDATKVLSGGGSLAQADSFAGKQILPALLGALQIVSL